VCPSLAPSSPVLMIRALFELLFTILIVMLARALLGSLLKGIGRASSNSFQTGAPDPRAGSQPSATPPASGPQAGGELHKDPVCGTYVAESTPFRRQSAGQMFYYCSSDCREKHALVAR
jgi:YHS domain-containing protein